MRPTLIILPLVVLSACATPREQCIDDAMRDTRVLTSLIAQTRGNLERGYAIAERQEVRSIPARCEGRDADGNSFDFRCDRTDTFTTRVPVAIDLNAEAAKLASLEERLPQSQAASNQGVAQCIAIHPE